MSKLFGLKAWYSIEEAAARLSKSLAEIVTEADLIQLAAEGQISVCWFLNGVHYGQQVLVWCPFPRDSQVEILSELATDDDGKSWGKSLSGPCLLPVDLCPSWGWWLLTFVGKGGKSGDFCGPLVIDDDGTTWELYDHKNPNSSFLHFPAKDEVVFRRKDLEDFETRLFKIDKTDRHPQTPLSAIKPILTGQPADVVAKISDTSQDPKPRVSIREQQISAIVRSAVAEGYNVLEVPTGGKKKLKAKCKKEMPDLFGAGDSSFDGAWKDAIGSRPPRIRMANHNKFASR